MRLRQARCNQIHGLVLRKDQTGLDGHHHAGQRQQHVSLIPYEIVEKRGETVLDSPVKVLEGHRFQQVTRTRTPQASGVLSQCRDQNTEVRVDVSLWEATIEVLVSQPLAVEEVADRRVSPGDNVIQDERSDFEGAPLSDGCPAA